MTVSDEDFRQLLALLQKHQQLIENLFNMIETLEKTVQLLHGKIFTIEATLARKFP